MKRNHILFEAFCALVFLVLSRHCRAQTPAIVQRSQGVVIQSGSGLPNQFGGTAYKFNLPNPSPGGNAVIFAFRNDFFTDATPTLSGDQAASYSLIVNANDGNNVIRIWRLLNTTAGMRTITVSQAGPPNHRAGVMLEVKNIATISADDGNCNGTGSSTTSIACSASITTTAANDFIFQFALQDSTGDVSGFTAGTSPWTLGGVDRMNATDNHAWQWQVQTSAGSITPTLTMSPIGTYLTAAIALKSESAGGDLAPGFKIQDVAQNGNDNATGRASPFTEQFPCSESNNLIVAVWIGASGDLNSITDNHANIYTSTGSGILNGASGTLHTYYAKNATCASDLSLTLTSASATSSGDSVELYGVRGADSNPFLQNQTNTDVQSPSAGALDTVTITPYAANNLVFFNFGLQSNNTDPPSLTPGDWDAAEENNEWGHLYTTSTSAVTFNVTTNNGPANNWVARADEFKAAGAASTPTAPANLTATATSSSQIDLTWTAATETGGTISSYLVERCQGAGCAGFTQIGSSISTTFNDTGLAASSSYSYRVRATDTASNLGPYSNMAMASMLAPTLTAPTNLTAASSNTQINLSWTAATETGGTISSYLVERCQGAGCTSFAQVGTSTTTTLSDTGLIASTSYSYRMRAKDAANNLGPYSNTASATTLASAPPPPAVSFVQVNAALPMSASQVAAVYKVGQLAGDLNVVIVGWNDTTATVTSVTDTKGNAYVLAVGPTLLFGSLSQSIYYAKNIAVATAGANTVAVKFSTVANYPDIRILEYSGLDTNNPLEVATGVVGNSATSDSGALTTTNANDLLLGANTVASSTSAAGAGYTRRIITNPDADLAEDKLVATTGSYHATATLTRADGWVMQVVAFKAAGAASTPTAPANLTATATSSSQIDLTWTAATETGGTISSYLVERCQGTSCTNFLQVGTSATTSFSDIGLSGSTSYTYRVRAKDTANNLGPYSSTAMATTAAPTITAPTNLTATAAFSTQINLSWTAATETGGTISTYLVERCQGAGCTGFTRIGSSVSTTFNDTGLVASSSYSYRVRATDTASNLGPYSNMAMASTLAPMLTAPTNLTAAASSNTQINLSWTAATETGGTISSYLVERCQGTSCTNFLQVGTSATTSFGDTGLSGSTSNTYRVRAKDTANNLGPYSSTAMATTAAPTITASTNLTATAAFSTQINLSWTAATETGGTISSYLVERCQGTSCTNFLQVGTSATTSFSDTGLSGSTSYTYRVRARDAGNNVGPYSSTVSVTTPVSSPPSSATFVQVSATLPSSSQNLTLAYPLAQSSGDLNVVIVGWNDTTAAVTSVSDTKGNVYVLAVGPTVVSGTLSQSIYYAKNIAAAAAGANTVAVKFSTAANYPDIRILEYSGVDTNNPLDVATGGAGNSATSDSGALTTTNANDLLVGANTVASSTSAAGSGYTSRIITNPDADLAEDRSVTTTGSYHATATLTRADAWVMQVVAFKATGAAPTPTAPGNLAAAVISSSQINLSWTASTEAGGTISSYLLERCQGTGCANFTQVGTSTSTAFNDTGLSALTSYSYRVRAKDTVNNLSAYSNTVTATTQSTGIPTPTPPTNLTANAGASGPVVIATQSYINGTSLPSHTTAAFDSTGGDLLVICASSHLGVTMTPSDSFGNSWISVAGPTSTIQGDDIRTQVWYARIPTVGPGHTVSIGLSVADSLVISVLVVKGSNTTTPLAAVSTIGDDGGTQTLDVSSPSIVTTTASNLLIGFAKSSQHTTWSAGVGYTNQAGASSNFLDAETGLAATPGSYNATFAVAGSTTWQAVVMAVNPSAAAANPTQINLTWGASTETGGTVSGYLVERCQGAGCTSFTQIGTSTVTNYTDTVVTSGNSYTYRVRASDTANTVSSYSNTATAAL